MQEKWGSKHSEEPNGSNTVLGNLSTKGPLSAQEQLQDSFSKETQAQPPGARCSCPKGAGITVNCMANVSSSPSAEAP